MDKVDVLDKGYVRLVEVMGGDLTVVNSARVSYNRESRELQPSDVKLIKFLARNDHTSPFRHSLLQFEVYAPLMVARQWFKYLIGSDHRDPFMAWNESSRRYVKEDIEFYLPSPTEWRGAPENSKQGSTGHISPLLGEYFSAELRDMAIRGVDLYEQALESGVAAEQARLFLPAYGLYVRWYWTGSLQSVAHFIKQRLAHDAQKEIRDYALAVRDLTARHFPISLIELTRGEQNEF